MHLENQIVAKGSMEEISRFSLNGALLMNRHFSTDIIYFSTVISSLKQFYAA